MHAIDDVLSGCPATINVGAPATMTPPPDKVTLMKNDDVTSVGVIEKRREELEFAGTRDDAGAVEATIKSFAFAEVAP